MSEKQLPLREFEPIANLKDGLALIREGAKSLASTMIWTKDQEQVINTQITVFSDSTRSFYCGSPKGFDPVKLLDDLKKAGTRECYFSVSLLRANIFFKTELLGVDHAGMQFKLPEKVYKVQRRKELRFPIPDTHTLRVEFNDPLHPESRITKKVLDISASGIAFLVDEDEAMIYQTGLTLQEFHFKVRGREIAVNAEIRNVHSLRVDRPKKGCAVGVVFKNIRPGDSQHIAGYVFEESRKYFSRFMRDTL